MYFLETFPSRTENFITQEIVGLTRSGLDIQVLAFKKEIDNSFDVVTRYFQPAATLRHALAFKRIRYLLSKLPWFLKQLWGNRATSFTGRLRVLKHVWYAYEAAEHIRENQIDPIHAHFATMPTELAKTVSDLSKVPYSFTAHAHDIYTQQPDRLDQKVSDAAFMLTCTECNHHYFQNHLSSTNLDKVNVVYHGISLTKWPLRKQPPHLKGPLQLLTVARLQEKKGLIYAFQAVKALIARGHELQLTVVGEGPLRAVLDRYIKDHLLTEHIKMVGSVHPDEVYAHYQQADIFLLPCVTTGNGDRDGLPNVLLEALATGVPVITTGISAIGELITDMETGLVVPERDPEAIAEAILRLKQSPELSKTLTEQGRARVGHFDVDKSNHRINQLFHEHLCEN